MFSINQIPAKDCGLEQKIENAIQPLYSDTNRLWNSVFKVLLNFREHMKLILKVQYINI